MIYSVYTFLLLLMIAPGLLYAESTCSVGDYYNGYYVKDDIDPNHDRVGFSCLSGRYKHFYFTHPRMIGKSCEEDTAERFSEWQSCGYEVNPCGEDISHLPSHYSCCAYIKTWVWECYECPNDPNKTELGICGCGVPDTDSDGDGIPDCVDDDKNNGPSC